MSQLKSSFFTVLTSRYWWLQSIKTATAYAPSCVLPAFALALGNVLIVSGTLKLYEIFQQQEITSEVFSSMSGSGGLTILGGLAVITWALGAWLVHLSAFARACMLCDLRPDDNLLKQSLNEVRKKKGYFFKVWGIASLYLSVPLFPLSFLLVCRALSSPEYASLGLSPLGEGSLFFINLGIAAVMVVVAAYALVLLVMSSVKLSAAGKTTWQAAKYCCTGRARVFTATLLVFILNTAISTPQLLLSGGAPDDPLKQNLYVFVAWQFWFALSSAILWPWSVIPFCHILRESEEVEQ